MTTITFKNKIINVEQNGTTFIASERLTFPADLSNITISDGENTTIIKNGKIVECYCPDERFYFSIIEKPYNEILEERLNEQEDIICDLLMNLL